MTQGVITQVTKEFRVRVAINAGRGPRRILWKVNKMLQFRRRCRDDIETSFRIFKCEVVCTQPRISLAAVVRTFSRRQLSAVEILS